MQRNKRKGNAATQSKACLIPLLKLNRPKNFGDPYGCAQIDDPHG